MQFLQSVIFVPWVASHYMGCRRRISQLWAWSFWRGGEVLESANLWIYNHSDLFRLSLQPVSLYPDLDNFQALDQNFHKSHIGSGVETCNWISPAYWWCLIPKQWIASPSFLQMLNMIGERTKSWDIPEHNLYKDLICPTPAITNWFGLLYYCNMVFPTLNHHRQLAGYCYWQYPKVLRGLKKQIRLQSFCSSPSIDHSWPMQFLNYAQTWGNPECYGSQLSVIPASLQVVTYLMTSCFAVVRNFNRPSKRYSGPVFEVPMAAHTCGHVITFWVLHNQFAFMTVCRILWSCNCNFWQVLVVSRIYFQFPPLYT